MAEPRTNLVYPNREDPCYDCGSTVPGHHTISCDLADPWDLCDLAEIPGTQYWVETYEGGVLTGAEVPAELRPTELPD